MGLVGRDINRMKRNLFVVVFMSVFIGNFTNAQSIEKEHHVEDDIFEWYRLIKHMNGTNYYGIADVNGNIILQPEYGYVHYSKAHGVFSISSKDRNQEGYFSKKGMWIIPLDNEYDLIFPKLEHYFLVSKNDFWGALDMDGKEIVAPKYEDIDIVSNRAKQIIKATVKKELPFTMAYCLDGTSLELYSRKIIKGNSQIGYITFFKDKIVIDDKETFYFDEEYCAFKGPRVEYSNLTIRTYIEVDNDYQEVYLYARGAEFEIKSKFFLMNIQDFQSLHNQYHGISNDLFLNNSINNQESTSIQTKRNIDASNYYKTRYGYKDCHMCRGSGTCQTCNGSGLQYNSLGHKTSCANCLLIKNIRSGKCVRCQGTGKVYGIK